MTQEEKNKLQIATMVFAGAVGIGIAYSTLRRNPNPGRSIGQTIGQAIFSVYDRLQQIKAEREHDKVETIDIPYEEILPAQLPPHEQHR